LSQVRVENMKRVWPDSVNVSKKTAFKIGIFSLRDRGNYFDQPVQPFYNRPLSYNTLASIQYFGYFSGKNV